MAEGLFPKPGEYVKMQAMVIALEVAPFAAYTLVSGSGGVSQIAQGALASFVGGVLSANSPSVGIHPSPWLKSALAGALMGLYGYGTGNPDFIKTGAIFAGLHYVGGAVLLPAVFSLEGQK